MSSVAVAFALYSCSPDKLDDAQSLMPAGGPPHGYVSAKLDGETEVFHYIEFTEYNALLSFTAAKDSAGQHGFTIVFRPG